MAKASIAGLRMTTAVHGDETIQHVRRSRGAAPSTEELKMGDVADVTDATWQLEVLEHDRPVLVDFWAPWCGPCRAVSRVLTDIAANRDDLRIVKLNVDDNAATASRYDVQGLPVMILFRDGQDVMRIAGAKPKRWLETELGAVLALPAPKNL